MTTIRDIRRQRHVQHLHRLGPRIFDELLQEIGAERSCMTMIETRLERFAALNQEQVTALEADRFPSAAIYVVQGSE